MCPSLRFSFCDSVVYLPNCTKCLNANPPPPPPPPTANYRESRRRGRERGGSRSGCGDESKGGSRSGGAAAAAIMSLRSFSRLLTRSFYPRKMNCAKVESLPGIVSQAASMLVAGRPARSLHTIRGVGAGGSTYGALAAAALTGGAGMLIFKKHPDDDGPVDGDVTMEGMKDVDNKPRQEDIKKEVDIKKDMGKHQMDVDMEAKFHKWMERMGREYPNQEEKAYRFELFKERMKQLEAIEIAGRVKNPLPNGFGDMTDDDIRAITNCHKPRSKEYEASLMKDYQLLKKKMEKEKAKRNVVNCSKQLIEGVVRSVSNLLEKFHQSFFLYFLTAPSKFVSVGVYMIPFALLVAPLPIVAAALADGSKSMKESAQKSIDISKSNGGADILQSKGGSWKWLGAAKVLLVIQLWAVLVSLLPYYITQIPDATPVQSAMVWAVLAVFILVALYIMFGSPYSPGVEWKLLKATMVTSISIGLGLMSIINFATAQLGALIVIPMCLFSRPLKAPSGMNILTHTVLAASNICILILGFPPAVLLIMKGLSMGSWTSDIGDFWVWMEFLWQWSSATYLYLLLVHLPCWLLCIHVLLHPCRQSESKMKQE